jgi:exosome complex component RRP43
MAVPALTFRTLQLKQYHELFMDKSIRSDGRKFADFRDVLIERRTIETSDGSCMVKMGNTTCIAGLKAILADPDDQRPGEGHLEVIVDIPPICNQKFKENRAGTNEESQAASERLSKLIESSGCFDLRSLCIDPERKVWSLQLQVICLDYDGNYNDACLIAALGALSCGSLPVVELPEDDHHDDLVKFTDQRQQLKLISYPISCTFGLIGDNVLADPTFEEESLSSGSLSIVWDSSSKSALSVDKSGGTGLTSNQFDELFKLSAQQSVKLTDLLKTVVKK